MAEVCASLNQDFHNLPVMNVMKCFTTREQCFANSQKSDDLIYEPLTYLQLAFAETGWTTSGGNFHVEYPVKVKSHWTNEISVWYMALYPLVSLCLILVCVGDGVWVGRRCAERTYKDIKSQRRNACKLCLWQWFIRLLLWPDTKCNLSKWHRWEGWQFKRFKWITTTLL